MRNISDWNISNALNQISDLDYNNKLKKLCVKQVGLSDKTKAELRNKVVKSLSLKGWEIDLIINQINQLIK